MNDDRTKLPSAAAPEPAAEGRWPRRPGRRLLFRNREVPVRLIAPNLFTVIGLCAGLTAIRMAIEGRYDLALGLVVLAALLDGVDGRLARLLKAQSRFGAELDSLADFVNFGVAPAVLIFTWGLESYRSFGWIVVMTFAVACGLRLARFNAALDVEKPRWQGNYFTGMPAPAGAIAVLLPLYVDGLGYVDVRAAPALIVLHTLAMAFMMVSTIPTFSGKLAGERVAREYVLPIFVLAALLVALLITYPYITLAVCTVLYLATIPISVRRFRHHFRLDAAQAKEAAQAAPASASTASTGNGHADDAQPPSAARP